MSGKREIRDKNAAARPEAKVVETSGRVTTLSSGTLWAIGGIGVTILAMVAAVVIGFYNALDSRIEVLRQEEKQAEEKIESALGNMKSEDEKFRQVLNSLQWRAFGSFQQNCKAVRGIFSSNLKTCTYPDGHSERFEFIDL